MKPTTTKVILVGGAPGAGKTTLGAAVANRLGYTSLSIDDLMTGAQAVTTPESHPELHVLRRIPYHEYFTDSTVETLKADADIEHAAVWPMVESVISKHATWGSGIVIDGWHLRPHRVLALEFPTVVPVWLVALPPVLEARERRNQGWLRNSRAPDRMLHNFLSRSLWYNGLIKEEAKRLGMPVLLQSGNIPVEQLCDSVVAALPRESGAIDAEADNEAF